MSIIERAKKHLGISKTEKSQYGFDVVRKNKKSATVRVRKKGEKTGILLNIPYKKSKKATVLKTAKETKTYLRTHSKTGKLKIEKKSNIKGLAKLKKDRYSMRMRNRIRTLDPFKSRYTRVYSKKTKESLGVKNPKNTDVYYDRKEDSFYTRTKKGYMRKIPVIKSDIKESSSKKIKKHKKKEKESKNYRLQYKEME